MLTKKRYKKILIFKIKYPYNNMIDNNNYKKAKMFNRKASRKKSKADEIIKNLGLEKGEKIADIGSGGGYFTFLFAEKVGKNGHVYAIDINSDFLEYIKNKAKINEINNISTILTKSEKPKLPEKKIDYIFLRNVCHHISNREKYFKLLRMGLKDKGSLIIIEHNGSGFFNFNKIFGHYIKPDIIKKDMKKAGFIIDTEYDFITQQSFTIFKKNKIIGEKHG
jgi:ubiquinone/menaquinone biosynthesis C-methylase UbiE